MIKITSKLWVGDSKDGAASDLAERGVVSVLNVAADLPDLCSSPDVRVDHIGLIDGPGNPVSVYCAAVLMLDSLVTQGRVLVYDHTGGRALAIAIMLLTLKEGRVSSHPTFLNCWRTWDSVLCELKARVGPLPELHAAHREAADRLPYSLLEQLL